jgi:hypothetical protein
LAGESDEAQFQATGRGRFCFKVDGHPNRGNVNWKTEVEPDRGLQANDAMGYALTSEHYLALKVRGKILAGINWGTVVPEQDGLRPNTSISSAVSC